MVIRELYQGTFEEKKKKAIEQFVTSSLRYLPEDFKAASKAGNIIRRISEKQGRKIRLQPSNFINDVNIAAMADCHKALILTENIKDFKAIKDFVEIDAFNRTEALRRLQ